MTETHEQRVERLEAAVREEVLARYGISIGNEVSRAIVVAMIASDREAGYVTVPVDLLKDCADDLEAWVRSYPSEARRYERDMEPVRRLRAAIAAHAQEERQDAP